MQPDAIRKWAADVRAGTNGGFQFNLWIPDPPPKRDAAAEAAVRDFLAKWGPPVPPEAGNIVLPDFEGQCDALLEASPAIVSSIMGLHAERFVARRRSRSTLVARDASLALIVAFSNAGRSHRAMPKSCLE
jgi:nitronate monooxygenase